MSIEFSAAGEAVRVTCRIGSVDLDLVEARRCFAYLTGDRPHGALRVRGQSDDLAALWFDRTFDGHLILYAAPATTRVLDVVDVMQSDSQRAPTLSRSIAQAQHARLEQAA